MKKITFQCKLLSDVVLNASGASEGRLPSLDFIPGSNFLGIVATKYGDAKAQNIAMDLFHNGNVRFGDAHMLLNNKRSHKLPAAWYFKKGSPLQEGIYLHHKMKQEEHNKLTEAGIVLKQARQGFFIKKGEKFVQITSDDAKYYAMKSAYDKERRRAEDEKLFGYTALRRDTCWQFTVTLTDSANNNVVAGFVRDILAPNNSGKHNIGLSRSAQYGRVQIDFVEENDIVLPQANKTSGTVALYADSRLAFFDEYGQPTLRPEAKMLGLPNSEIIWEKSQILTSRYSPWNGKRRVQDADRICIEKGSVFIVEVKNDDLSSLRSGVGYYKNDGFGEIIIDPDFLTAHDENGKLTMTLEESGDIFAEQDATGPHTTLSENSQIVVNWLENKKQFHTDNQEILKLVNEFTAQHHSKFQKEFASQWGMIR